MTGRLSGADPPVHGYAAGWASQHRVQVQLGDLWVRNHQVCDRHDSFRNETQVYRRAAPQPAEDRGAPQGRQHGPGLTGIHRGHGQLHIALRLDQLYFTN